MTCGDVGARWAHSLGAEQAGQPRGQELSMPPTVTGYLNRMTYRADDTVRLTRRRPRRL
jgi:hypothetical protein